jgi:hypothetical protein
MKLLLIAGLVIGGNKMEEKAIHGKLYTLPSGFRVRWCEAHQKAHAYLHECPYFSDAIIAEIKKEDRKKLMNLGLSIVSVIIFVCLLMLF